MNTTRKLIRSKSLNSYTGNLGIYDSLNRKRIKKIEMRTIQILSKYFDNATYEKKIQAYTTQLNNQIGLNKQRKQDKQKREKQNNKQNVSNKYFYGAISNGIKNRSYSLGFNKQIAQQLKKYRSQMNEIKQKNFISKVIKKINKTKQSQKNIDFNIKQYQKQKQNQLKCLIQDGNLHQWNLNFSQKDYAKFRKPKSEILGQRVGYDLNFFIGKNKFNYEIQKKRILQRISKLLNNQEDLIQIKNQFNTNPKENQNYQKNKNSNKRILKFGKQQKYNIKMSIQTQQNKFKRLTMKSLYRQNIQKSRSISDGWCMKHANLKNFYSDFQKITNQTPFFRPYKGKEKLKLFKRADSSLKQRQINIQAKDNQPHSLFNKLRIKKSVLKNQQFQKKLNQNQTLLKQNNNLNKDIQNNRNNFPSRQIIKRTNKLINQKQFKKKLKL